MNIKVIFGMKLKRFREESGLSPAEFADRTGLSPSYVNEIEKGKKYPKAEKIARMAEALGKSYDDLVSIKLGQDLTSLEGFLNSSLLADFPFELFGISIPDIVGVMTRSPNEASALIKALVEIANQYDLTVEHFFRAALRSYQESNDNYFEEIEQAVDQFAREHNLSSDEAPSLTWLENAIKTIYGYQIDEETLSRTDNLSHYRSVWLGPDNPKLLINSRLTDAQKKFVLAREIGYQAMGIKDRAITSAPDQVDSFEQVLNDFRASYFAGALLINSGRIRVDLKEFFKRPTWDADAFINLIEKYDVTPEIFFYRLSELIPQFFGIKLHFLRFNSDGNDYSLVKQLNQSRVSIPSGVSLNEHYCRRWLSIRLLKELDQKLKQGNHTSVVSGAQVSQFVDSADSKFLCIGLARPLSLNSSVTSSVIIGFRYDKELEKTVKFARDKKIRSISINETCERCRLTSEECAERAAPPSLYEQFKGREN
ncbi:MAG TPA: XRE family transcriptional regulator, partial [Blastocatellia bacterium]|nr:XRE family transcriptional regulator [Blastocatellia bacterium]